MKFSVINKALYQTNRAFVGGDITACYKVAPLEEMIDTLCDEYKRTHIERVRNNECQCEHGFVFNDMLTDLERTGDHCSNLGIAMRIRSGEMTEHHGALTKREIEETHDFEKYYKEYQDRFL